VVRCPYHFRSQCALTTIFNKDQETQVNAEGNVINAVTLLFILCLTGLLASLFHVDVFVALLIHDDGQCLGEQEPELLGVP
jgi:hypothetical protein